MSQRLERAARLAQRAWWVLPVLVLAIVLLLALQLLGLDRWSGDDGLATARSTIHREYDLGPSASLTIDNWRGDVTVRGAPGTRLTLTIVLHGAGASPASAQRDIQRMATAIDQDESGIRVVTRPGQADEPAQSFARIEVGVPAGTRVAVTTGGGAVEVSGVEGDLLAVTRLGDILVRLARGRSFQVDANRAVETDFPLSQQRPPAGTKVRAVSGPAPWQLLTLQAPGSIRLQSEE